jgi:regulator of protease activity HflC (stomatin/prohibitin superfamily)
MFDRLLDIVVALWESLMPFVILDPYEGGIMLRLGSFRRELVGGKLYWRIPWADRVIPVNVVPRTERLTGLATTTSDGHAVGFDAVVTYQISDLKKAVLEVDDMKDVIADSCAGIIGTELSNATWQDILHGKTVEGLTAACRKRGWRWGVEILQVQLTGVATVKNFRVSLNHGHDSAGALNVHV